MPVKDRIEELLQQRSVTGIDFIYVHASQVTLDVFFLRDPADLEIPLVGDVLSSDIHIYSESGGQNFPEVPISQVDWSIVDARHVLRITTTSPGDFSRYRLLIDDERLDPYYNDKPFTFKANCPSDLDCKEPPHECPPESPVDFPVNYLARDFWSIRRALLDFAAERWPDWKNRLEADVGMMLVEVMSALGDELAYYQDRIGREAYLETASQRRSLRRHARLVDYTIHDGLGASTWLDFTVLEPGSIPVGTPIWEPQHRVVFEVGGKLSERKDPLTKEPVTFGVDVILNEFRPHLWDEDDICLPVGSTTLFLEGHHQAHLPSGKWVLLKTLQINSAISERAWLVRLVTIEDTVDSVFNQNITKISWDQAQATPFELDLTALFVRGNLVPATEGETQSTLFVIGPKKNEQDPPEAVERVGSGESITYLYSLPGTEDSDLAWLGSDITKATPEILLSQGTMIDNKFVEDTAHEWIWKRSFLGVNSSQSSDAHFILDDGFFRQVISYRRDGKEFNHIDYASSRGVTIRFGDAEFGLPPTIGQYFRVTYRLSGGRKGNLPVGSLTNWVPPPSHVEDEPNPLSFVEAVTNPLSIENGIEPETSTEIRQLAPEAFRAETLRAVRPEDYANAAERLDWVQRAGASFRWTGSWLTAFVTPDPKGAVLVTDEQRAELREQIDRFRQAGREAYELAPLYADIDLEIRICVAPSSFQGEVKERVLDVLFGKKGHSPHPGFFSPDNFTFGTPLRRSVLEKVIQSVEGVRAVEGMRIQHRRRFRWRPLQELVFPVADNEVLRITNDRRFPEQGSLRLTMVGGA